MCISILLSLLMRCSWVVSSSWDDNSDEIAFSTGHKNPHDVWNRLQESHPEVVGKTDNFQFPGQGQRLTPVATLQVFIEILVTLPGKLANTVREEAVSTDNRFNFTD